MKEKTGNLSNILIIDDSMTSRAIIKNALLTLKFPINNIYESSNGMEGVNTVKSFSIDIIILDIKMPIMDGIEFINWIKTENNFNQIPIIVVASYGTDSQLAEAKKLGVNSFLRKPLDINRFKEALDLIDRYKSQQHIIYLFYKTIKRIFEAVFLTIILQYNSLPNIEEIYSSCMVQIYYHIRLNFNGDKKGCMDFYLPYDFSQKLVYDMALGSDNQYNDDFIEDNLNEFVNIVGGHFFSDYFSHNKVNFEFPVLKRETFDKSKIDVELEDWQILRVEDQYIFYKLNMIDTLLSNH